jgi:hypothetical protein
VIQFLVFVLGLPAAIAVAIYFTSDYWLPIILNTKGNVDQPTLHEIAKVLPTAIAAMFASIVAAGTAVISVGLQRKANLRIEDRRGEILNELQKKKSDLEGELDTKRQQLTFELGVKRAEMDGTSANLKEAHDNVSEYRYVIGDILVHGVKDHDLEPVYQKLSKSIDILHDSPELHQALVDFRQSGYYLFERFEPLKSAARRRAIWAEKSQQGQLSLGIEFGQYAEHALELLRAERKRAVEAANPANTT